MPQKIPPLQFILTKSAFLEYLGFDALFETFPKLDDQNKIFSSVIDVLKMDSEKDVIVYLYDQIFVECLTQIKGLKEIHPEILVHQIHERRKNSLFLNGLDPFSLTLENYEKKILDNPQEFIHDLTLYLAWDRVCVYLAAVFDHASLKIHNGLEILKECLIESFEHITEQDRTKPSFFRLVEALYAYEMKEENLQKHTDLDWQILCQSAVALRAREYLADASYVDAGISKGRNESQEIFLILDAADKAKASLTLAEHMETKLALENSGWAYTFRAPRIVFLESIHLNEGL